MAKPFFVGHSAAKRGAKNDRKATPKAKRKAGVGRYRHHRPHECTVIGVACHSETEGEYGDHGLWTRPNAMFMETVDMAGRMVSRFE